MRNWHLKKETWVILDWLISPVLLLWPVVFIWMVVDAGKRASTGMNWAAIAGFTSAGGLIFFAWRSLRLQMVQLAQQDLNTRSQTYTTIQGRVIDINKYLAAHPHLEYAITLPYPSPSPSPASPPGLPGAPPTFAQIEAFSDVLLTQIEELYYQYYEFHLVNKEIWDSWEHLTRDFKKGHPYLDGHLKYGTTHYSRAFRAFYDRL